MDVRFQPEKVRKPRQSGAAPRQAAAGDQTESAGIARVVASNGHKLFTPKNPNGLKPALELFAGCAAWSRALCHHGFTVHAYDICWGSDGDILSPQVFAKILSAIKRQDFSVVHFGMPCESWSLARKWDGGPPPLRDNDLFLYGRPNLTRHDREKVLRGNELLKSTCQLALACMKFEIPGTIENPQTSRAWLTNEMHGLIGKGAFFQHVHYCQYGKPWKKATSFLGWLVPNFEFKLCQGSFGFCSASQCKHVHLQGQNSSGVFLTLLAQPYPASLVDRIAKCLTSSLACPG